MRTNVKIAHSRTALGGEPKKSAWTKPLAKRRPTPVADEVAVEDGEAVALRVGVCDGVIVAVAVSVGVWGVFGG